MAHKHVVNTHALVWNLEGSPNLGPSARAVLADVNNQFVLPLIALAEAVYIVEKGRTAIPSVTDLLLSVQADPRFDLAPLTLEVLQRSLNITTIPEMHDRLIVATALHLQTHGHTVSLLTKDATIVQSSLVPIVW